MPQKSKVCRVERESQTTEEKFKSFELAKLEKVDAFLVSNDRPGIQIQLLVKPEKVRKRFFETVLRKKVKEDSVDKELYAISHLNGLPYNLLVYILKPLPTPKINWKEKQVVLVVKNKAISVGFLIANSKRGIFRARVILPFSFIIHLETAKSNFYICEFPPYEERTHARCLYPAYTIKKKIAYSNRNC